MEVLLRIETQKLFIRTCNIFICLLTISSQFNVDSFNIGTSGANIIKGISGSYFGATVNFLTKKSKYRKTDEIALLVSASNQTYTDPNSNTEEVLGTMQVCTGVLGPNYSCTPFHLDDLKAIKDASLTEHFGSAVAVTEDGFHVICSPQWMDTNAQGSNYQFLPGRCTTVDPNKEDTEETRPYFNTKKNWGNYVTKIGVYTLYYEGTALFGLSVDALKDQFFIAGAPGVLEGEGSVVYTDLKTMSTYRLSVDKVYNIETTAYGYLGYAVKIGSFCASSDICFAASAPNLNRVGMVKIFKLTKGRISDGFEVVEMLPGQRAWSYFGYALGACDVNSDGIDELLVGAPHQGDTQDPDQGRVHVYSKKDKREKFQLQVTLEGDKSKFSRFGSSIQCIGDINLDGYVDIAIGAPGENNGAGAVYVYMGSKTGLSNKISQKIEPSSFPFSVEGLGYAISGPQTIKGSNYPVVAISSIKSDAVVILQSRPVVVPTVTITAVPNPVDLDETCSNTNIRGACFQVKLCLSGAVRQGGTWDNSFLVSVAIDTKVKTDKWKRALFWADGNDLVSSISDKTVKVRADTCVVYTAAVMETQVNQDRFSPVFVEAHIKLASTADSNTSPILDALSPDTYTTSVTFQNDCGSNNKCEVDLSVNGEIKYTGHEDEWNSIVIDETKELLVDLVISNQEETAYWTSLEISVDSPITYSRQLASSESSVTCQASTKQGDLTQTDKQFPKVICNYYKPLEKGSTINIGVAFDTYDMPQDKERLKITARVRPNNEATVEMKEADNVWEAFTDVRMIANVVVHGASAPPEVTIQNAKRISLVKKADVSEGVNVPDHEIKRLDITHKILVQNEGPSNLLPTKVTVGVPYILQDGSLLVHSGEVKMTTARGFVSPCKSTKSFNFGDNPGRVKVRTTTPRPVGPINPVDPGDVTTKSSGDKDDTDPEVTTPATVTTTTAGNSGLPDPPINRRRRRRRSSENRAADDIIAGAAMPNIYLQSCELDPQYCQVFECDVTGGIASGSHVELNVSLVMDTLNIPVPKDFDTFYYTILTEVKQPEHPLFKPWKKPRASQSLTKFHLVESDGDWNIWLIIGGVIGGLLLLTIVALILWKSGFFKRNKHQQVAKWKRESQRRSRYSSSAKQDGNGKED